MTKPKILLVLYAGGKHAEEEKKLLGTIENELGIRKFVEENGYDWAALTSGLGHLNMNQLKTFFAVAEHICFDTLGKDVLNFKTPKAFDYFISCKDTHKSWESFEIFLHGMAFEFIRMYMEQEENPTPHGFII